jgi:hypothetical protein
VPTAGRITGGGQRHASLAFGSASTAPARPDPGKGDIVWRGTIDVPSSIRIWLRGPSMI